jgi:hypothetical protein
VRLSALTVACFACVAAGAGRAGPFTQPGVEVTVLTPVVALGSVAPDDAARVPARLTLTLHSSVAWQLGLRWRPDSSGAAPGRARAASDTVAGREKISVRLANGLWQEMAPGMTTPLVSGPPTSSAGTPVTIELRAEATLEGTPGRRRGRLQVLVNSVVVPGDVKLDYEVAPQISLAGDALPTLAPGLLDPTKPGVYPLDRRAYTLASNSPWLATVRLRSRLQDPASGRRLPADALVLLSAAAKPEPLVPGDEVVLAQGPATGRAGATFELRLAVILAGGEKIGRAHV